MELFYKRFGEEAVAIPHDSILLREEDICQMKSMFDNYPNPYCLEVDGINAVCANAEGIFDFGKSIVDIGACAGEWCWLTPFRKAYAFEPNKESACLLCANALMHGCADKTDVHMCFLSDRDGGSVRFNGFNTLDVDDGTPEINTYTLDSFHFDDVGLIKIDVEMLELEVLRGAVDTIERCGYPPIVFECFDVGKFGMTRERYEQTMSFLEMRGYGVRLKWVDQNTHLAVREI